MKLALILNPHVTRGTVKKLFFRVQEPLKRRGIQVAPFPTQYHGHAVDITKELRLQHYDGIVALGGDGTNYQVLNGLLKYHGDESLPPLGIIPLGRGNSFAKDLGIHSLEDGIASLAQGRTREVDVCRFTQKDEYFYFVNLLGLGFVSDVAKTAAAFRWAGDFSYIVGVFYRTLGLTFHDMELEIDGADLSGKNCFVEFCNSRYTGGDMLMAPEALIDDGYFDAVIVSPLSRISLISTLPKIFKGTHGMNPAARFIRGRSALVRTSPEKRLLPDGELFGVTPMEITVVPRRVKYFCIA